MNTNTTTPFGVPTGECVQLKDASLVDPVVPVCDSVPASNATAAFTSLILGGKSINGSFGQLEKSHDKTRLKTRTSFAAFLKNFLFFLYICIKSTKVIKRANPDEATKVSIETCSTLETKTSCILSVAAITSFAENIPNKLARNESSSPTFSTLV